MQEHFAVFFGAILIAAAMTASHPIPSRTLAMIEERLANNWYEMEQRPVCDDASGENCQPPMAVP